MSPYYGASHSEPCPEAGLYIVPACKPHGQISLSVFRGDNSLLHYLIRANSPWQLFTRNVQMRILSRPETHLVTGTAEVWSSCERMPRWIAGQSYSYSQAEPLDGTPAAAILLLIGVLGLFFNIAGLLSLLRMRSAFGRMCMSFAANNAAAMLLCILYYTPLTYLGDASFLQDSIRKHATHVLQFFWYASLYCHLAISINRLLALMQTGIMNGAFDPNKTAGLIALFYIASFIHTLPYFWEDDCYMVYLPDQWTHQVPNSWCGSLITTYLDFFFGIGLFVVMAGVDVATLVALKRWHTAMERLHTDEVNRARQRSETIFFIQSLAENVALFVCLLCNNVLDVWTTTQWQSFLADLFAWMTYHAIDGFILVIFQVRKLPSLKACRYRMPKLASTNGSERGMKAAPPPDPVITPTI